MQAFSTATGARRQRLLQRSSFPASCSRSGTAAALKQHSAPPSSHSTMLLGGSRCPSSVVLQWSSSPLPCRLPIWIAVGKVISVMLQKLHMLELVLLSWSSCAGSRTYKSELNTQMLRAFHRDLFYKCRMRSGRSE